MAANKAVVKTVEASMLGVCMIDKMRDCLNGRGWLNVFLLRKRKKRGEENPKMLSFYTWTRTTLLSKLAAGQCSNFTA
jgi:chemotaxis receptor (MCP) glutamine deamidase CheD